MMATHTYKEKSDQRSTPAREKSIGAKFFFSLNHSNVNIELIEVLCTTKVQPFFF